METKISRERAIQIIQRLMSWMSEDCLPKDAIAEFEACGLDYAEIRALGFGYLLEGLEDEDE